MWSFKLKLVLWFALLALLPLGVAFYGYDTLAKRSETRRVDAGLEAGLRGAVATYGSPLPGPGGPPPRPAPPRSRARRPAAGVPPRAPATPARRRPRDDPAHPRRRPGVAPRRRAGQR